VERVPFLILVAGYHIGWLGLSRRFRRFGVLRLLVWRRMMIRICVEIIIAIIIAWFVAHFLFWVLWKAATLAAFIGVLYGTIRVFSHFRGLPKWNGSP
jgi:hypothetical protein